MPHRWFVLGVAPRHEKAVSQLLRQKGYDTFLPLYVRSHKYARRTREFELPLFPGYLFCRLDPMLRMPILTTPGVLQFIGAGRTPIPVPDDEIEALRRAAEAGIPMIPHPYWKTGQTGRITSGPLNGIEGIVVQAKNIQGKNIEASNQLKLVLSISLLQRSVLLEIDSDCVISA